MASLELPPFSWPKSPEEVKAGADAVISAAEENLNNVAASEVSFANTLEPLMLQPNYKTNPLVCQSKFLQHCSTDADIRKVFVHRNQDMVLSIDKAAEEAGKRFATFKAQSRAREDVYLKVKEFSELSEATTLSEYYKHFLDTLLLDFKRGGLALPPSGRADLQALLDADSECCSKYGSNLGSDATRLRFKPSELEGLPQDFIDDRLDKNNADEALRGDVVLTLKYPDIIPVMGQCHVAATREKVTRARGTAYGNNLELVSEGIGLRKQIATLLGYPSWSHYVIETRMAQTPETVTDFLGKIRDLASSGLHADLKKLAAVKKTHLLERGELKSADDNVVMDAWDGSFYHNRVLKSEYGVDTEEIRNYFPLDHVLQTTLAIYQELLGLVFTEIPKGKFDSWHDEVRLFVVHNADDTGTRVGHFYLDLHPRDGKYGHAAIFHLLKHSGKQTAVDCMLCNLPARGTDGKCALLRHDDVVTFFHEFGHIMHGLCSEGDGNSTHLAKCPRDFVEAPSQMLENWCWQESILQRLSHHHLTGEKLPKRLIDSMAKNVHESMSMMRQIYLATLDLTIHGTNPPLTVENLQALVDRLREEISGVVNPAGCNMLRNFGHLMNQYSAAYYGYLWAEVISADMFETRFAKDCMNPEAGRDYRNQVLAPGGTGRIMDHLTKFLGGRPPQQQAFLRSRGILQD